MESRHGGEALYPSVLTLGEIRRGTWLEYELPNWFGDRLLTWTAELQRWGRLLGQLGRPVPSVDSIHRHRAASHHELRLVTPTEKDFNYPWLGSDQPVAAVATSFAAPVSRVPIWLQQWTIKGRDIDAVKEGKHPNLFVAFGGVCGTFAGRR